MSKFRSTYLALAFFLILALPMSFLPGELAALFYSKSGGWVLWLAYCLFAVYVAAAGHETRRKLQLLWYPYLAGILFLLLFFLVGVARQPDAGGMGAAILGIFAAGIFFALGLVNTTVTFIVCKSRRSRLITGGAVALTIIFVLLLISSF